MNKKFITTAAFVAALAVILGAFGAHALKEKLSAEQLQIFETETVPIVKAFEEKNNCIKINAVNSK